MIISKLSRSIFGHRGLQSAHRSGFVPLAKRIYCGKRFYASKDITEKDKELGELDDTANTGVIEKTNQETLLYFTDVNPADFSRFKALNFVHDYISKVKETTGDSSLERQILKLASPEDNPVKGISVNSILTKDGGAFVKFQVPFESSISEVNTKIQKNTMKSSPRFLGLLSKPHCFPVKGTPWVEDLRRYPSSELKVLFEGEELTEEKIYQIFRRYGTILDIVPQPADSKETPRYAIVKFRKLRSAIAAKNCVNAFSTDKTTIHIKYQTAMRENLMKQYVFDHPRISIPLILAVFLAIGSIIFEPIREFFIQEKIEHRFGLSTYKNNKYFVYIAQYLTSVKRFMSFSNNREQKDSTIHMWTERLDKVKELKLWLTENVNTFIVVRGPRGIGKENVVIDHALRDRKNVLHINCEEIVKSRNDSEFLKNTAHQFGYFPIFPWLNSLSTFIDLGVQGLTGQKSGLSESNDVQFKNILSLAAVAIRRVSLRFYSAYVVQMASDMNIGEEATKRITEDDYLQQHPDEKPVIVINKFSAKSENYSFVYQALASWGSFLVSMNLAHVIFLIDDVSPVPLLSEALPDQIFKSLVLSDPSKSSSTDYVWSHLNDADDLDKIRDGDKAKKGDFQSKYSIGTIEKALEPIGGRMLDLQAFIRRVKSGESPEEAKEEMIKQTAEQIIQMNLIKNSADSDEFQVARSWEIIKFLASKESIAFSNVYTSPLFKSSPVEYLTELEKSNLISLVKEKGLIKEIKASRPLYRSAFQNIVGDETSFNVLEGSYLLKKIAYETKVIKTCESEISSLSYVAMSDVIRARFNYLGDKITACTNNIKVYEAQIKELVKKSNELKAKHNKQSSKSRFGFF
ncbi:Yme2 protein [Saccharomycopsis crataegensis]|uniref:Mitochondrial escape protein 2 n=1 Tax=Saccharomycopsis crataegensis TaxID=43959 RepID=A0AAV5QJ01_9ASCO|nr:Yme2 protein [Saccharomycopsis crataegensis]